VTFNGGMAITTRYYTKQAAFGVNCVKFTYCQRQNSSPESLVSGNIWLSIEI